MVSIFIGILGILLVLGLGFLLSNDKKNINFRAIIVMIVLQILITLFMFKTTIGLKVVEAVSNLVATILNFGYDGIDFVLGGLIPEGTSVFFMNVLMLIIFTSTLLSILTHIKVLPFAIKYIGGTLAKITGLSKVVTFNSINSIFFGQSESILAIKAHLDKMNDNKLFIISTSAMASVSAGIMGSYMTMIPSNYVLVAMILNALSSLIVATIIAPIKPEEDEEINIKEISSTKSVFEAISNGALDGGKVALIVAAMLVAYIALMSLLNAVFDGVFGMDLTTMLGYVFAPVAWIMGIPASEIVTAGSIMGTKLATNEFVAMLQLQPMIPDLTEKTVAIVSTFLVSFANFSSIGIISGSIQAVNGEKARVVANFGLKMLLASTLASVLSATMVGLFS
ncbi:nucleoside transport protein [Cytobacillus horneckiae]|uniref:NupC/NupG family nucleoside CNT transporter n=1 Tax=Cytobacillus horneckiae TaxID=549687 RepID=A0A2N0ZKY8_9BACI|nr:nucleoside transporter C-terminal domain-containing protein [Cytobacillus horneckiae]NRG47936.1 NupC/NupG family nucleoside CNT transporter [Bacillus sp. CRN 9]MBN6885602.1 NupC/NupG family nucleoside CNT transporter [Cytobacillus horneckiae]MCM3180464.1 NupC/NupG family nucleoside CNT transporter [Cytobacillus horneckiae]MEC1156287.1 nucleoside transporter C-terminal domain-containing protein [Cytobacillus horneckiae]MED2938305.1 nucleoside transporter C-terminal domain-containing protein 